MTDAALRDEINKRLTLNWLIQGAAQHAGITLHHLVRDELSAINEKLVGLYDQYALINLLQYWHIEAKLLMGSPRRFWKRAATRRSHMFTAIRCFVATAACSPTRRGSGRSTEPRKSKSASCRWPSAFRRYT